MSRNGYPNILANSGTSESGNAYHEAENTMIERVSGNLFNASRTIAAGDKIAAGILNPKSLAELEQHTSLDGQSVFSISNRDYYDHCFDTGEVDEDNNPIFDCDCPQEIPECKPVFALEKHITVIRKGPTTPPLLEMYPYEDILTAGAGGQVEITDRADVNVSLGDDAVIDSSFTGDRMHQSSNFIDILDASWYDSGILFDGSPGDLSNSWIEWSQGTAGNPSPTTGPWNGNAISTFNVSDYWGDPNGDYNKAGTGYDRQDISMFFTPSKEMIKPGGNVNIPIAISKTGEDWQVNDQLIIEYDYLNSFAIAKKATARLQIINTEAFLEDHSPFSGELGTPPTTTIGTKHMAYGYYPCEDNGLEGLESIAGGGGTVCRETHIEAKLMSTSGDFPIDAIKPDDLYNVKLVQKPPIFEVKFPKFAYRYKYEDGEYSPFGPWSEIAFIPSGFDYSPKKGYNLGMQNKLRKVNIKNWVPKNIPKDVVQVDILYKESNSPNIYTVSSHKKYDPAENGTSWENNYWNTPGTGGNTGFYTIKSELIHKVVKSNQLLRPWDNVPRKALAQEITANRLIFANYVQNFDLKDTEGKEIKAVFTPSITSHDYSIGSSLPLPGYPGKSLKSMRTYQLGVVYRDRYGRETPVLTSKSGSVKLAKKSAKYQNRLSVQLHNEPPYWAESFTFYIKETSNEYYNVAMDRWYDAEDGGIWLSFPSVERNKISDTTNLILKKQHDTDVFTDFETRYKVLSIKNDAPTFIKTENRYWGSLPMMLPPPGWGDVGNWDSGMFYNTGLPLPNRMFLDIFAEYWEQSPFNKLSQETGAQIRIVQSAGQASAYQAGTSDTTNKTKWYNVANLSYIGSPPQTQTITDIDPTTLQETTSVVELPGQQEQLVRISLEKTFGDDALFCNAEGNLSLARGLSLEVRTQVVRDKAQFEGRFFIKILRDANIEQNIIQPQSKAGDKYQVLHSKKIKYICDAHPGLQDWSHRIIDGGGNLSSKSNFIPIAINQSNESTTTRWGLTHALSVAFGINSGVNQNGSWSIPEDLRGPRIVSSLSKYHAWKGAGFVTDNGGVGGYPDGAYSGGSAIQTLVWPFGPGRQSLGAFDTNYWGEIGDHIPYLKPALPTTINKLVWPDFRRVDKKTIHPGCVGGTPSNDARSGIPIDGERTQVIDGTIAGLVSEYGRAPGDCVEGWESTDPLEVGPFHNQGPISDWPSFGPQRYNPYLNYGSYGENLTWPGHYEWTEEVNFLSEFLLVGPYQDRIPSHIEKSATLKLRDCPALEGTLSSSTQHIPSTVNLTASTIGDDYMDHNYLQGANPYNVPAIWGNQADFTVGLASSYATDGGYAGWWGSGRPSWTPNTFMKLREDWWYLWRGRDDVDPTWPLGRFSPQRWIIDKVGAAQGYSGNGIWDDGERGYMDISFWGVGRTDTLGLESRFQSFARSLERFNENELGFADALRTSGTQFRFKHDPDQTVYTILNAQEQEVYNYESPQGDWAYEENGTIKGGSGIGRLTQPPWGGDGKVENGYGSNGLQYSGSNLSGGKAFISDLYSKEYDMIGSHPSNRRIRWTLTLDKIIGSQGEHKFHPLTNHVDKDGKANIDIGRAKYHVDLQSQHVTPKKGGTPAGVEYYNLASYWNTTEGSGGQTPALSDIVGGGDGEVNQPDTVDLSDSTNFYARNPLAYIGLHERGLNQTEIEIVTPYRGEDRDQPISSNPAIWETEPREDVGLDIYYAISPSYPISLEKYRNDAVMNGPDDDDYYNANWYDYSNRGEEVMRVGSVVEVISLPNTGNCTAWPTNDLPTICKVQGSTLWLTSTSLDTGSAFNSSVDIEGEIIDVPPRETIHDSVLGVEAQYETAVAEWGNLLAVENTGYLNIDTSIVYPSNGSQADSFNEMPSSFNEMPDSFTATPSAGPTTYGGDSCDECVDGKDMEGNACMNCMSCQNGNPVSIGMYPGNDNSCCPPDSYQQFPNPCVITEEPPDPVYKQGVQLCPGTRIRVTWRGEGTFYGIGNDKEWMEFEIDEFIDYTTYTVKPLVHNNLIGLGYYNCWSYSNGVESNRIRDDYNAVTIDKGVKASMPLATPYEEERRASGLIFSGIYNSTSGVNETNQFIQAEPITKDLNPINGSIQKLFARDTDLLTFCENKVFKILAKKDALFNADGNTNITSNAAVLGQSIPFTGEYGISRNPESFASESYRVYFTDKDRGAVLRLSRDGLTPISDAGMKDWFKDNMRNASSLIGSYDNRDDQYNLTLETADQDENEKAYTVSYTEIKKGWVSFKSFINQGGISHKNTYYTIPSDKYSRSNNLDPWGVRYTLPAEVIGEIHQHALDLKTVKLANSANNDIVVVIGGGGITVTEGMYVTGNGVGVDVTVTEVVSYSAGTDEFTLRLSNDKLSIPSGTLLTFTTPRNTFNNIHDHYSMIKVLFNGDKGTVKRFKTLDYEGSQAKTIQDLSNNYSLYANVHDAAEVRVGEIYEDNKAKLGWYVENIKTDMQDGEVPMFINKENKWFNNISSSGTDTNLSYGIDTAQFSLQGLGGNFLAS